MRELTALGFGYEKYELLAPISVRALVRPRANPKGMTSCGRLEIPPTTLPTTGFRASCYEAYGRIAAAHPPKHAAVITFGNLPYNTPARINSVIFFFVDVGRINSETDIPIYRQPG